MLRATRAFLASRWSLVGLVGAAVAVAAAAWSLIDTGDVAIAALALLLGLALLGLTVTISSLGSADRRIRSVEARLKKVASAAEDNTAALRAIQAGEADPAAGPLGAVLGAQRVDASLRHDELLEQNERLRTELRADLDQVQADLTALHSSLPPIAEALKATSKKLDAAARPSEVKGLSGAFEGQLTELSALANLYTMFDLADEVPVLGGFAAAPRTILRLVSLVRRLPTDALIVECGSGSSTIWLGLACRHAGRGRVVALEHHELYTGRTREALTRHGLDGVAEVRFAPLEPVTVGAEKYDWYGRSQWAGLAGIDLLFVDGPPGSVGPRSRYPAFPLLAPALDDGAIVALDDAQRQAEADIAADWLAEAAGGVELADDERVGRTRFFTATRR